ncbi:MULTISPECIES: hypothetical protein [Sphingobium]|uniref:hypothetical protein n=1 Tax=Sphingobium sp. MI1205 TaxID=407020 RepID=UPI000B2255CD|nr:hypothetical protein [Sphingobium sp. MI1205]
MTRRTNMDHLLSLVQRDLRNVTAMLFEAQPGVPDQKYRTRTGDRVCGLTASKGGKPMRPTACHDSSRNRRIL